MARVEDNNYYQISGWMLKLGLKGTNLMIYAIVYGFSQDGEGEYNGSLQYLAEFTGASRRTVINALKELTDKGLIIKEERVINRVKFNAYKVSLPLVQKLHGGGANSARGVVQFLHGGGANSAPNNKYNNKDLNNKDNIYVEEFKTLWAMYPNKQGKQRAQDSYLSARKKGTTYEEVKDGIERYDRYIKREKIKKQYIKHGSTYFSQRAWQDEYEKTFVDDGSWGDVFK